MTPFLRLLSLVIFVGSAINAAVIYNESVDGDITSSTSVTLGVGVNTVLGTTGHFPLNNTFDSDAFEFILPVGTQLDSLEIIFSNITYLGPTVFSTTGFELKNYSIQPSLRDSAHNFLTFADNCTSLGTCQLVTDGVALSPSFTATFSSTMPLTAGTYGYAMGNGGAFASVTTTYNFTVSAAPVTNPVPEPMTALLMAPAIGVAYLWRKRRTLPPVS